VERWWRTASFSALASSSAAAPPDALDGRDHDADEVAGLPGPDEGPPIVLGAFPRGARAGVVLHSILEQIDFDDAGPERLRPLVVEKLGAHGMPLERTDDVVRALDDVLRTPLGHGAGGPLAGLPRRSRIAELEFWFPVATPALRAESIESGRARSRQLTLDFAPRSHRIAIGHVTQKKLAAIFRDYPSPDLPSDYHEALSRLRFLPLRGWLKGFVDLVFERDGRYYVVDYKTNHLGDRLGAYAAARLPAALAAGHYYLQYHLYSAAVHRWLALRVPGYDYARCFGGAYYLFLKGMTPATGPASGVFFDKPPQARIEALCALLERPRHEDGA
jgi:exodeoxyribonuclease V beta subunit